jgi:hypothetical protein
MVRMSVETVGGVPRHREALPRGEAGQGGSIGATSGRLRSQRWVLFRRDRGGKFWSHRRRVLRVAFHSSLYRFRKPRLNSARIRWARSIFERVIFHSGEALTWSGVSPFGSLAVPQAARCSATADR